METLFSVRKNNKFGYINNKGQLHIDLRYEAASGFDEGLARVKLNDKWGFINTTGDWIFTANYDICSGFHEGLAYVEKERKYGYIDKNGNLKIPLKFKNARGFEDGLALVVDDEDPKGAFIDQRGEKVLRGRVFLISKFRDGLINAVGNKKWGFIDINNQFVIKPQYNFAYYFSEGKAAVSTYRDYFGFIDTHGHEIIPCKFRGADVHFSEGFCDVSNGKHYGYINDKGDEAIPYQFYYAGSFKEGRAIVKLPRHKKYGVINMNGEPLVDPIFQHIDEYRNGLAQVIIGHKYEEFLYGYIDRDGNYVWKPSR